MLHSRKKERGISIIEAMVSVSILGLVLMSTARGISLSLKTTKRTIRESRALTLALEKMEQMASKNPTTITTALNGAESLTVDLIPFTRNTTVTVNADNSRTVQIDVNGNAVGQGGDVSITNTFALWGNS